MGSQSIKPLTPTLALLNVRLGYWLKNPKYAAQQGMCGLAGMAEKGRSFLNSLPGSFLWQEITGIPVDDLDWYLDFTAFKTGCLSVSTSRLWGWPEPDHAMLARQLGL